uniref:uncharacterized protein n=1 Tax=Pristiophorus japonicus TaxID=55135 RepID=UPI00398EC900
MDKISSRLGGFRPDLRRSNDRSTASNSGVTQPSPDFTPARDEDGEEQLTLEPVEVGVEMEEEITVTSGPAGTSSTTDSIFRGFSHASSDSAGLSGAQQGSPSIPAPLPQRQRLVQQRSIATRQIDAYHDMVHLSKASVDIGQELLKAMAAIAGNIAALSERQSEDMSHLKAGMRRRGHTQTSAEACFTAVPEQNEQLWSI